MNAEPKFLTTLRDLAASGNPADIAAYTEALQWVATVRGIAAGIRELLPETAEALVTGRIDVQAAEVGAP